MGNEDSMYNENNESYAESIAISEEQYDNSDFDSECALYDQD